MSLSGICVEVRKHLRCANVFLQFEHSLDDAESELRINVMPTELQLQARNLEICVPLAQHFNVEADTLSNLIVEQKNASFRLSIDNIKKQQPAPRVVAGSPALHPALREGSHVPVTLHCANCKCQLIAKEQIQQQPFQRIREFPTGAVDMNEFFCHGGPSFDDVLVPQLSDLFYGFQFIVLNAQLLQGTTLEKQAHLYCARCLQLLGETLFAQRAAKLWSDALKLHCSESEFVNIFIPSEEMSPVAQLLQKIVRECRVLDTAVEDASLPQPIANVKVLISTSFPDRRRHHLLLHILEQQLQVLRNEAPLTQATNNNNVVLQSCYCFKLLYQQLLAEQYSSSLLSSWQQDITIQTVPVSPTMYATLLQELNLNSLLLPETYRYAHDAGFALSYVFYC